MLNPRSPEGLRNSESATEFLTHTAPAQRGIHDIPAPVARWSSVQLEVRTAVATRPGLRGFVTLHCRTVVDAIAWVAPIPAAAGSQPLSRWSCCCRQRLCVKKRGFCSFNVSGKRESPAGQILSCRPSRGKRGRGIETPSKSQCNFSLGLLTCVQQENNVTLSWHAGS
jgi:hypothetical protein